MNLAGIQVGDLCHRVTLQQQELTPDGQGGSTAAWSELSGTGKGTVWARVQPISGQEAVVARQLQDSVTHKVLMRYRPGVTAKLRLKWGSRTFNIREVRNLDEMNTWLELRCEEGVAT